MDIADVRRTEHLVSTLYANRPERRQHIRDVVAVVREMRTTEKSRLLTDPEVVAAAYLHDVLDDVVATRAEIRTLLGDRALALGEALSESFTVLCGRRCTFFENLPALIQEPAALEVRLAARYVSWRQALETGDEKRLAFYRQDYQLFRSVLVKVWKGRADYWIRLDGLFEEQAEARWEIDGVWHFGVIVPGVDFR